MGLRLLHRPTCRPSTEGTRRVAPGETSVKTGKGTALLDFAACASADIVFAFARR
jgi:hypothetical protein